MITQTKKTGLDNNRMISDLVKLMEKVKDNISDSSDIVWTGYDTPKQLRDEIQTFVNELSIGNLQSLNAIQSHFLPTSTFQEHSLSNGWGDEYIRLAEKFDHIYSSLNNHS